MRKTIPYTRIPCQKKDPFPSTDYEYTCYKEDPLIGREDTLDPLDGAWGYITGKGSQVQKRDHVYTKDNF